VEEKRYTEGVVVGKPEGKLPVGRPRRRFEYNIKMAKDRDKWW
jgi:hypothetical protein